ncbi:CesT family type III secretion system chaperone [Herbaspirillum sp. RV1423]|uniref:CesT family type III secretion system chaperone n=1 Tax=Herbaspirillum sp. RV1423 TaxID=1443993 RepID=UPI0004B3BE38|nr:CesT family type III secretion system chaperone [Herbaspirillum sp. RV1423]
MSKQLYEKLIHDLCEISQNKNPKSIIDGGPVSVNDVVFSIHPGTEMNEGTLLVYCDFGEIFKGREAEVSRMLLEANLLMYAANGPMYAISPLSGRVIYQHRYAIDALTGKSLRDALVFVAAKAKEWRKTQLLDNPPVKANAAAANLILRNWTNTAADGKN